jgi:hypothetical protein
MSYVLNYGQSLIVHSVIMKKSGEVSDKIRSREA